jgi:stearoyl-CoA desaturase (Delta-9 desaturase)
LLKFRIVESLNYKGGLATLLERSATKAREAYPLSIPSAATTTQSSAVESRGEPASITVRLVVLLAILIPFIGVVAATYLAWGWGFRMIDLALLSILYVASAMGISVGYHRLFVHRSFDTNIVVKFVWAVLGSMAVQGRLLGWVANHRLHHQHSDSQDDPHSPHGHEGGLRGVIQGIWHSHIGWLFQREAPGLERYVQDLSRSRALRLASKLFPLWVTLGLVLPAVVGGLVTRTWWAAGTGLIWGGLVRIFLVHHVTWSVNSACHLWGKRPYRTDDQSRNNALFGLLAMGEGWHNTHHAFPSSARHGLRWWQIDLSYWAIKALALVGLAWNVKLPSKEIERQRRILS